MVVLQLSDVIDVAGHYVDQQIVASGYNEESLDFWDRLDLLNEAPHGISLLAREFYERKRLQAESDCLQININVVSNKNAAFLKPLQTLVARGWR